MTGGTGLYDHLSVSGLLLGVGTGVSPETMNAVANVEDLTIPMAATEVLVTNVSDTWVRRVPTLLDMGKVSFKVWWVPSEVTHRNSQGGGNVSDGLRYLFINKLLRDWNAQYPDADQSTDAFSGYVTGFNLTGKVGAAFEATIGIGTTGIPSLV
jgi:hypothetical protein